MHESVMCPPFLYSVLFSWLLLNNKGVSFPTITTQTEQCSIVVRHGITKHKYNEHSLQLCVHD